MGQKARRRLRPPWEQHEKSVLEMIGKCDPRLPSPYAQGRELSLTKWTLLGTSAAALVPLFAPAVQWALVIGPVVQPLHHFVVEVLSEAGAVAEEMSWAVRMVIRASAGGLIVVVAVQVVEE